MAVAENMNHRIVQVIINEDQGFSLTAKEKFKV